MKNESTATAARHVNADELREWLENGEPVFVLDVRPANQREEWQIPGSHYLNAYKRLNEGDLSVLDEIALPENTKVVTVCAAGRTSEIASNALRKKGIEAFSLEGGMKSWSLAWNIASKKFDDFEVLQVRRTGKGCLSYIIFSNKQAAIIDASLPAEVYQRLIQDRQLFVKYVLETHIHADHLSRSRQVAEYFQAPLFLPVPNRVQFPHFAITEGRKFSVGNVTINTLATPGHTLESVSFYVPGQAVFTGDTLFTNGVGRPDLKADEEETRHRAGLLYHSLENLLSLPDETLIFPAHTDKPADFDGTLMAVPIGEARKNIPLLQRNENDFVDFLLQHIPPTPPNYLTIVEKNIEGDFSGINPADLEAGANRCAISSKPNIYSGSVPQHYEKYQGPVFFEPYALEVASRIDPSTVHTALEIACGTGRVTNHLRKVLAPGARLVATDLSPGMLAVASEKLKGQPIEWRVADAQQLPFDENSFDLVVCCFGYMFLPDKVKAFAEAYRVLREGGMLLFTTWDKLALNGASQVHRNVVKKYLGDDLPEAYKAAFAMNNDEEIKKDLLQAGFGEIILERVDKVAHGFSAKEIAEGLTQGGSIYNETMKRNPDWVPQITSEIEYRLAENFGAAPMNAPMRALVTTARKRK